jgi:hypothetical protein
MLASSDCKSAGILESVKLLFGVRVRCQDRTAGRAERHGATERRAIAAGADLVAEVVFGAFVEDYRKATSSASTCSGMWPTRMEREAIRGGSAAEGSAPARDGHRASGADYHATEVAPRAALARDAPALLRPRTVAGPRYGAAARSSALGGTDAAQGASPLTRKLAIQQIRAG